MANTHADLLTRLRHDEHRQLFEYWRSKAPDGRLPARADIDPLDLRTLLPRLGLIDVLRDDGELTFRYRLTGTEIVERAGRDPTGKTFEQLYSGDYLATARDTYRQVVEHAEPFLSERTYPLVRDREFLRYDRLLLPLATDGATVDMVMLSIVVLQQQRMDDL